MPKFGTKIKRVECTSKICELPTSAKAISGSVKKWRNCPDRNNAVLAACHYAVKQNADMAVVRTAAYMAISHHIVRADDFKLLDRYRLSPFWGERCMVDVVRPNGEVWEAEVIFE